VNVLAVNMGSSSLKLSVLDDSDSTLVARDLDRGGARLDGLLREFLGSAPTIDVVGHRVVHGGPTFSEPIVLRESVDQRLETLAQLAPLHNPPATEAIRALLRLLPGIPQVACFDTSFHSQMPPSAYTYPVPRSWSTRWGIRRYGFHGLSHDWASQRAAALMERPIGSLRLVTAHLGSGASLAAVRAGRSVDTTMGFTPLEGLAMATRSGSLDPGIMLWVLRNTDLGVDEVEQALESESGLFGMSGVSGDLRVVIDAADAGNPDAALAYEVYSHRIRTSIASMAASMGGVDAVVFTGGAGERSARLRHDTCSSLEFLGIELDGRANDGATEEAVVSTTRSAVKVAVVAAREDRVIAQQVRGVLAKGGAHGDRS
jgi:acetate kinase